jgi:hypothetical protein
MFTEGDNASSDQNALTVRWRLTRRQDHFAVHLGVFLD